MRSLSCVIVLLATGSLQAAGLGAGDPAPKLSVAKWVKGEPVVAFEKGKVYVIECWATWCGPCREAIPEMTAMQRKYADRKVVVIGMNVFENDPPAVEAFVKKMGDKMDYRVALDVMLPGEGHGQTAVDWMKAAKQHGIPCTFVVDGEGKIAFIGHPHEMEEVLDAVLAGNFDARKAQAVHDLKHELHEAQEEGRWDEAMALLAKWKAVAPEDELVIEARRFHLLLLGRKDDAAAYKLAREQLVKAAGGEGGMMLNALAWTTLTAPGVERRDVKLAVELATRAAELTGQRSAAVLDTLGLALFTSGRVADAVAVQKRAIEVAPEDEKAELRETLKKYEAGKG